MRRRIKILAFALTLAGQAACSGPSEDLTSAQRRWVSAHVDTYVITVRRTCYCGAPLNFEIHVQGGAIATILDPDTGAAIPVSLSPPYFDVMGLFAVVDHAIRQRADRLQVAYNSDYGYPERITIDWDTHAIDDEDAYRVTAFRTGT